MNTLEAKLKPPTPTPSPSPRPEARVEVCSLRSIVTECSAWRLRFLNRYASLGGTPIALIHVKT
jgi:hypothetical protein